MKIHHLQANSNKIDLVDVSLFKPNGIDVEDTGKAFAILFCQHQPALSQLNSVIGILDGKPELSHRIFEGRFCRLRAKPRAFDAITSFPSQFEQLRGLREQLPTLREGPPLRSGALCSD